MDQIRTVGIDLAKSVFQVHGIDATGAVVLQRRLRRAHVIAFFAKLPALPRRAGGLRQRTSLGTSAARSRP
jgi:transposase